jgi:catechol 2,3-dioxygenase-like lactoylglutathione lyase family enzyme
MIKGGSIIVGVSDLDAAIRFYTEALGLRLVMRFGGEWAVIDAPRRSAVQDMVQLLFFHDPDGNRLSLGNMPPSPTSVLGGSEDGRLPFLEHLALRWTEMGAEGVTAEIDIRDDLRGPAGTLQGGVIATLVDVAAAATAAQGAPAWWRPAR